MRRVFDIENISFSSVSQNGFFLLFNGHNILAFNTAQAASDAALSLNLAIAPTISALRLTMRQQINNIINA